jgi:hypothetical protein
MMWLTPDGAAPDLPYNRLLSSAMAASGNQLNQQINDETSLRRSGLAPVWIWVASRSWSCCAALLFCCGYVRWCTDNTAEVALDGSWGVEQVTPEMGSDFPRLTLL